jgi:surface antigen
MRFASGAVIPITASGHVRQVQSLVFKQYRGASLGEVTMSRFFNLKANTALITASILLLTSCQQTGLDKENSMLVGAAAGGALGGIGGYFLGNQLGGAVATTVVTLAGAVAGAWLGTQIAAYLSEEDQERAAQSFQTAAATGETNTWKNPETGVSGTTKVVSTRTASQPVAVPVLKDRVEQVPPLDLIGESYVATRSADVHGGPGTDYKTVGELASGNTVMVAGKVQKQDWYMISEGGAGAGFVSTPLLRKAPPDAQVAISAAASSGPIEEKMVTAEQTCRTVQQVITLADGSTHEEDVTACQTANGWQVV